MCVVLGLPSLFEKIFNSIQDISLNEKYEKRCQLPGLTHGEVTTHRDPPKTNLTTNKEKTNKSYINIILLTIIINKLMIYQSQIKIYNDIM